MKIWHWTDSVHNLEVIVAFRRQRDLRRIAARVGLEAPDEAPRLSLNSPLGSMALTAPGDVFWRPNGGTDASWQHEELLQLPTGSAGDVNPD